VSAFKSNLKNSSGSEAAVLCFSLPSIKNQSTITASRSRTDNAGYTDRTEVMWPRHDLK